MKEATDFQAGTVAQYHRPPRFWRTLTSISTFNVPQCLTVSRDAALPQLSKRSRDDVSFTRPEGGYFIWVEAPGINATEMVVYAMNEIGVAYVPGDSFYASCRGSIRLDKVLMTEDKIGEGIGRLGRLLKDRQGLSWPMMTTGPASK